MNDLFGELGLNLIDKFDLYGLLLGFLFVCLDFQWMDKNDERILKMSIFVSGLSVLHHCRFEPTAFN